MILCEKEFLIPWQIVDDDTLTNVGEETVTINVWADTNEGIGWTPVSHSSDIEGRLLEFTNFTDSLGRRMLARAAKWFDQNEQWIQNEDPDFKGWRHINYIEREADHAWTHRGQI
jgi:hypothetical protein